MYHVIELNAPGAVATRARAVNAKGMVCGTADYSSGSGTGTALVPASTRAVLWDAGGVGIELSPTDPIQSSRFAAGINDADRVVGGYTSATSPDYGTPFRWDPAPPGGIGGMTTDYVRLSSAHHYAFGSAINNAGWVAGRSTTGLFARDGQAVLWKDSSTVFGLGTLGGLSSSGQDINEYGQVAGESARADGTVVGFLWTPESPNATSGKMIALDLLPDAKEAAVTAINDRGGVVGNCSGFQHGGQRGFLWSPKIPQGSSGATVDLGVLPGALNTWALDVNSSGDVVGSSDGRAFLYRNGRMYDLNVLVPNRSWIFSEATAVNEAGWIAGNGIYNQARRAFLLIPFSPQERLAGKLRAIAQVWHILFGVRAGEGGIASPIAGGPPVPVDPGNPVLAPEDLMGPATVDLLANLAIGELATLITDPVAREQLRAAALRAARGELEKALGAGRRR
jgi:probable HAF family extracellular repeat protein